MKIKLAYVAGPYRASTEFEIKLNIEMARRIGAGLARKGYYPVIPHSNTSLFEHLGLPDKFWLDGTLELMRMCDLVVMCPDWQNSEGAKSEYEEAKKLGIPVYLSLDDVPNAK
jgi:hypothetical protein